MSFESKYVNIDGYRIHYVEAGTGQPTVLLLHGIPTHLHLWRNVIPIVSAQTRTIAIDLVGFGQSDKPLDLNYDLPTYTQFLERFVEALDLEELVIVGMDLGLMVGVNFAMHHHAAMKGLVLMEGIIQPLAAAFKNMGVWDRFTMRLLRIRSIAEKAFVRDGQKSMSKMITHGVVRELSQEELDIYREPWHDDVVRRKVWLEGVGPHTLEPKSRGPGDLADLISQYSARLQRSPLPKLLLTANPGAAVREGTLAYARTKIANLETQSVGAGKHFLPEDQPEAIGRAIVDFCRGLDQPPPAEEPNPEPFPDLGNLGGSAPP
jgi:haloalkane dehalogenase